MYPAPGSTVARCPRCRNEFRVFYPPTQIAVGWSYCPRCGQPTPVLPPHPHPPLFTWEVYPGLYPETRGPRQPLPRTRQTLGLLVLSAALLLLGIAVVLGGLGALTVGAGDQGVSGTVLALDPLTGVQSPLPGAWVNVTGAAGGNSTVTGPQGSFGFPRLAPGEHALTVAASGYGNLTFDLFLSPYFKAPQGNLSDLALVLLPASGGNASRVVAGSPFPDLESYLASVFSTSALEALTGLLAVWGAISILRGRPPARGVVGASAAVLGPVLAVAGGFTLLFLQPTPWLLVPPVLAGVLGLVATAALLALQRPLYIPGSPPRGPPPS